LGYLCFLNTNGLVSINKPSVKLQVNEEETLLVGQLDTLVSLKLGLTSN
jgi:hypothetical protein